MKKKLWKTLLLKGGKLVSDSGNQTWEIGKWYKIDGDVEMCERGFHASENIIDAMGYANPEALALVEARGKILKQDDQQCASEMRLIKAWEWTKPDSVALAIYAAELVIKNFEREFPGDKRPRLAIEAAKAWLKNPTEENRSAAESAARSAWSAAESAESAESAADIKNKCHKWIVDHTKTMKEIV
jgi:hypothetical protein